MGGMEGGGWRPPAALAAATQQGGVGGGAKELPPPPMPHTAGVAPRGDPDQGGLAQAMGACFSAVHGRMPSQQELMAGKPTPHQKGGKGKGRQQGKGGIREEEERGGAMTPARSQWN